MRLVSWRDPHLDWREESTNKKTRRPRAPRLRESKRRTSVSATSGHAAVYRPRNWRDAGAERGRIQHLRRVVGIDETVAERIVLARLAEVLRGLLDRGDDVVRGRVRGRGPYQRRDAGGVRGRHRGTSEKFETLEAAGH